MNPCDPTINRPVPSTGEHEIPTVQPPRPWPDAPPFMPVKCDRCGHMHNLHGDCLTPDPTISRDTRSGFKPAVPNHTECPPSGILPTGGPQTEQLSGQPRFNSLHISHLPLKVDGHTEHLFVAILNGEAVGQALALKQEWGTCALRMLYVSQKHRHMGIGSRLVSRVQVFAHNEKCNSIEIAVHKGNTQGRQFWIRRRFIDMDEDRQTIKEYTCMMMAL